MFLGLDIGWRNAYYVRMQHGSEQLRAWLERSRLDQRSGAKTLGIHYTTLNKLLKGHRSPGREAAIDIEAKTGIPVAAWTTRVGKRQNTNRHKGKLVNVGRGATHVSIS